MEDHFNFSNTYDLGEAEVWSLNRAFTMVLNENPGADRADLGRQLLAAHYDGVSVDELVNSVVLDGNT